MLSLITYDTLPAYTDWNANNPILDKRDCTKVFYSNVYRANKRL